MKGQFVASRDMVEVRVRRGYFGSTTAAQSSFDREVLLMKKNFVVCACALALIAMISVPSAHAGPILVSTIDGFYGGTYYDTPWITISNSTADSFTNVQMTLTGYQGLNNGVVSPTINLGTIAAGTTQTDVWGSLPGANGATTAGNMTAYD